MNIISNYFSHMCIIILYFFLREMHEKEQVFLLFSGGNDIYTKIIEMKSEFIQIFIFNKKA